MKKWYTISMNGQKAVDVGYSIQKNHCYHVIKDNDRYLTQIEVVVDNDGFYNGNPNKWVDVSYINIKDVEKVLSILSKIGFSGCPAILMEEQENGYILKQKELCCFII